MDDGEGGRVLLGAEVRRRRRRRSRSRGPGEHGVADGEDHAEVSADCAQAGGDGVGAHAGAGGGCGGWAREAEGGGRGWWEEGAEAQEGGEGGWTQGERREGQGEGEVFVVAVVVVVGDDVRELVAASTAACYATAHAWVAGGE